MFDMGAMRKVRLRKLLKILYSSGDLFNPTATGED